MSGTISAAIGLVLLGGFLQRSFALPMKSMSRWRRENTWLVYSTVGMLVLPWIVVTLMVPHLGRVLESAPDAVITEGVLFGFVWSLGSTLFDPDISRVGMALTFAIVLGIMVSLGLLLPLLVLHPDQLFTRQGYLLMAGLAIVVLGIVVCSLAGYRRERELSRQATERGGNGFWLGLVICILSSIFSAVLNFSFVFGKDLQQAALAAGASAAISSNVIWALALGASFAANAGYCIYLLKKNRTWGFLTEADVSAHYWLGAVLMGAIGRGTLGAVLGGPVFKAMDITVANV